MMGERVKSGILGLDEILDGGFFTGQTYGITGGPGSGKSIFTMEFLVQGAQMGEKGLYISSEVSVDKLIKQMKFWDLKEFIDSGDIVPFSTRPQPDEIVVESEKFDLGGLIYLVKHYVKNKGIKRVVFDSVTAFVQQYENKKPLRRELNNLIGILESMNCTTLLIFESQNGEHTDFMEFAVDGVIELGIIETREDVVRYLQVKKMRGTSHDMNKRAMEIQDRGIIVTSLKPFLTG
jgi:KaiC/GvpD/RAD55 family RecA-like ATPase